MAPRFNAVIDIDAMLAVIYEVMQQKLFFLLEAKNLADARKYSKVFKHLMVPKVIHATRACWCRPWHPGVSIRDADRDASTAKQRSDIGRDC